MQKIPRDSSDNILPCNELDDPGCDWSWELEDETIYTSCSPCVYKQGECSPDGFYQYPDGSNNYFNNCIKFDPNKIDVGRMKPLPYWGTDFGMPGFAPKTATTTWNGQNWIFKWSM